MYKESASWEPREILCFNSSHDTDGINGTMPQKSFDFQHGFQFAFCFFTLLIIVFFFFMLFTKCVTFVEYLYTSNNNQYIVTAGTDLFAVPRRVAFLDFAWMTVTLNRVVYSCIQQTKQMKTAC